MSVIIIGNLLVVQRLAMPMNAEKTVITNIKMNYDEKRNPQKKISMTLYIKISYKKTVSLFGNPGKK